MTDPEVRRQRRIDLASAVFLAIVIILAFVVDRPDEPESQTSAVPDVCTQETS